MAGDIYIRSLDGELPAKRLTDADSEAFQAELMKVPLGFTANRLGKRLDNTAAFCVWAYVYKVPQEYKLPARLQHGLSAMAQHEFEVSNGLRPEDRIGLNWLPIARNSLVLRAVEQGYDPIELITADFFATDIDTLERLHHAVNSRIYPGDTYENYAFAAGVATGQIKLKV